MDAELTLPCGMIHQPSHSCEDSNTPFSACWKVHTQPLLSQVEELTVAPPTKWEGIEGRVKEQPIPFPSEQFFHLLNPPPLCGGGFCLFPSSIHLHASLVRGVDDCIGFFLRILTSPWYSSGKLCGGED